MKRDWTQIIQNQFRSLYANPLLQGKNSPVDNFIFGLFEKINETGKLFSTERSKRFFYKKIMVYLLEVVPGYDSSQPFLGSIGDELEMVLYKKRRFLEIAKPGDVILVKGNQRISRIIQTLTVSPYSHAAYYHGNGKIIESDPAGVLHVPIDKYLHLDLRICRPVMLSTKGKKIVSSHMEKMLALQPRYDITNIEQLLFKYMYQKVRPDIKVNIGGNTEFERSYICSGIIAHGFHKADYPVTPQLQFHKDSIDGEKTIQTLKHYERNIFHRVKNYTQIVPGDFDNSPFFASIKYILQNTKYKAEKRKFKISKEQKPEGESSKEK